MKNNPIINIYKGIAFSRCDDRGDVHYFTAADFDGLITRPFEFCGNRGQTLRGGFYFYGEPSFSRIIIFEHGMGGGHLSYMREIAILASYGYTVFSYDHTGCMSSDGESTGGFSQSVADLDYCIRALKGSAEYKNASISVIGHSWGGYSTMNIGALHPDVTHVVVIAGFISVKGLLEQFFGGFLKKNIPYLYELERESNPDYVDLDGITSLGKTEAKALLIYSANDPTIKKKHHYVKLYNSLKNRSNTEFILTDGKGHNPNYTKDAVKYLEKFSKKLTKMRKKKLLYTEEKKAAFKNSFDWWKMTEQDKEIWAKIKIFLED